MSSVIAFDQDLNPVLRQASTEDLEPLVKYLKKARLQSIEASDLYKNHFPDHSKYPDQIASSLREMGGNSFRNLIRTAGPSYIEIVRDVADKLKAPYNKKSEIQQIEASILSTILEKALQSMSPEEQKELLDTFESSSSDLLAQLKNVRGELMTGSAIALFNAGGFASYQMTLIIANQIARATLGHGLALATNAAITRVASFVTGPVGIAVTALWTLVDLAGPAYRVTIPSVIYIAMLRQKMNLGTCESCGVLKVSTEQKFCNNCGKSLSNDS